MTPCVQSLTEEDREIFRQARELSQKVVVARIIATDTRPGRAKVQYYLKVTETFQGSGVVPTLTALVDEMVKANNILVQGTPAIRFTTTFEGPVWIKGDARAVGGQAALTFADLAHPDDESLDIPLNSDKPVRVKVEFGEFSLKDVAAGAVTRSASKKAREVPPTPVSSMRTLFDEEMALDDKQASPKRKANTDSPHESPSHDIENDPGESAPPTKKPTRTAPKSPRLLKAELKRSVDTCQAAITEIMAIPKGARTAEQKQALKDAYKVRNEAETEMAKIGV